MASSSGTLHESADRLQPETIDRHRALASLMEELEAVDWYDQRIDATGDEELRRILEHNRDEEKEHAAMVLEWIRRRDTAMDAHLRKFLFSEGSIAASADEEEGAETPGAFAGAGDGTLGIGSLRGGDK
jgi:ferritin-like protein